MVTAGWNDGNAEKSGTVPFLSKELFNYLNLYSWNVILISHVQPMKYHAYHVFLFSLLEKLRFASYSAKLLPLLRSCISSWIHIPKLKGWRMVFRKYLKPFLLLLLCMFFFLLFLLFSVCFFFSTHHFGMVDSMFNCKVTAIWCKAGFWLFFFHTLVFQLICFFTYFPDSSE